MNRRAAAEGENTPLLSDVPSQRLHTLHAAITEGPRYLRQGECPPDWEEEWTTLACSESSEGRHDTPKSLQHCRLRNWSRCGSGARQLKRSMLLKRSVVCCHSEIKSQPDHKSTNNFCLLFSISNDKYKLFALVSKTTYPLS